MNVQPVRPAATHSVLSPNSRTVPQSSADKNTTADEFYRPDICNRLPRGLTRHEIMKYTTHARRIQGRAASVAARDGRGHCTICISHAPSPPWRPTTSTTSLPASSSLGHRGANPVRPPSVRERLENAPDFNEHLISSSTGGHGN